MFIGLYHCSFNKENRVELPGVFRGVLTGQAVVTQGFERNLLILPGPVFQNLFKLVTALNIADPLARGLQRMLLGHATFTDIDHSGNLEVPEGLKEFAQLASEIILVGQGNYVEVWSQPAWQEQEKTLSDAEANAGRFTSLNLAGL